RTFAGIGWRVPEFLAAVRAASGMYFDTVARVDVADWARGRIALLGDASSCVSLFGEKRLGGWISTRIFWETLEGPGAGIRLGRRLRRNERRLPIAHGSGA